MSVDLYMWGERGLVASFFTDLYLTGDSRAFEELLRAIQIDNEHFPRSMTKATVIIEPDFSNKGFGHPDAMIRVERENESSVIIVQAKRGRYAKACRARTDRGVRKGFNSTLNGQLELCYALALALERFTPVCAELVEPDWILNTPYSVERQTIRGHVRRLKNQNVLRDVVARFAGLPLRNYFFLTLTTDCSSPFLDQNLLPLFPELFHPDFGTQDCWTDMKHQFGWINYSALEDLSRRLVAQGDLGRKLLFEKSWELNRRNMESGTQSGRISADSPKEGDPVRSGRGTSLIYAPSLNATSFLHFSWWGESSALRDYSQSSTLQPLPDRRFATSEIRKLIQREIVATREAPVESVTYWQARISALSRTFIDG
jgi:hypothetical protein